MPRFTTFPTDLIPLYEAVLADLDADGPRYVLADALIERDDPRGTFINHQLGHSKKASRLLELHRREWIPEPVTRCGAVHFQRGFPFHFNIKNGRNGLPQALQSGLLDTVQSVRVRDRLNCEDEVIELLAALPNLHTAGRLWADALQRLTEVRRHWHTLEIADTDHRRIAQVLPTLHGLRSLTVDLYPLGTDGWEDLLRAAYAPTLRFCGTGVDPKALHPDVRAFTLTLNSSIDLHFTSAPSGWTAVLTCVKGRILNLDSLVGAVPADVELLDPDVPEVVCADWAPLDAWPWPAELAVVETVAPPVPNLLTIGGPIQLLRLNRIWDVKPYLQTLWAGGRVQAVTGVDGVVHKRP
jgi:uncharacterized protein (TIGR02996 family)